MVSRTYSVAAVGLEVYPVEIEVDGKRGVPQFVLIGLASRVVEEAKERITSALQNCQIRIRSKRTIVNLAPASVPKTGTAFDLAITVGLLKMYGELKLRTEGVVFLGELALDGQVKPIIGALPLVLGAIKLGFKTIVLPVSNAAEVSTLQGITIYTIQHLNQLLAFKEQPSLQLPILTRRPFVINQPKQNTSSLFHSLVAQEKAKRAVTLTAAGGHNLLLIGPPGTGKTQLSKSLIELLPPLTESESIEVTAIHSLAGLTPKGLITTRPFRTPHHSISRTALIGGGHPLKPGEVSLAHRGVLFLDELLEFPTQLLDMLRQPLEDKYISLSFATNKTLFPTNISLVAATNPCPCGYLGSSQKSCSCLPSAVARYQQKLSGALLDRFDLVIYMETSRQLFISEETTLLSRSSANSLELTQEKIKTVHHHLQLTQSELEITQSAQQLLNRQSLLKNLSARRYKAALRVAKTIAYLAGHQSINETDVQEAISYQEM